MQTWIDTFSVESAGTEGSEMNGLILRDWKGEGKHPLSSLKLCLYHPKEDLGSKVKGFVPACVLLAISKH